MNSSKAYLEPLLRRSPDGLQRMVCAETDRLYWRSPYGLHLSEIPADDIPSDKAYLASKEIWELLAQHSGVQIVPFWESITPPSDW